MKKLNLEAAAFQKGEVLTRSQLKMVLGGSDRWIGSYGARCDELYTREQCTDCCTTNPEGIKDPFSCIAVCKEMHIA